MSTRLALSSLLKSYEFPLKTSPLPTRFIPSHRLSLIDRPTPIEILPLFSSNSPQIFIKRDDQLDHYACGNKLRKLEFLFADLLSRQHCEHVITAGSLHSNHCKAVAVVARRFGLQPHLLLRTDREKTDEKIFYGNPLIDYLIGAKLYFIPKKAKIKDFIQPKMKLLEEELGGKDRCYSIPLGGSVSSSMKIDFHSIV